MSGYKTLSWSAILLSAVLLVLPRVIPVCTGVGQGGNPMQCHFAYQAEFLIALLALIFSSALLVLQTTEARTLSSFLLLLLGITIAILPQPWVIGICAHGGACVKTAFFSTIIGSLLGFTGALLIWVTRRQQIAEGQAGKTTVNI
ncbi:DUF4418 family protein [Sporomusa aerivorans]|uniref:DUF4418 family protein n=1 Tax=Sporomusa aerivorans TaxID=204936 RepID=UPI00352AFDA6